MESIPVKALEFMPESGNTLWIQGNHGGTILRIKCTGKIRVHTGCASPHSHGDLLVHGDIELCMPEGFEGLKKAPDPAGPKRSEDPKYLGQSLKDYLYIEFNWESVSAAILSYVDNLDFSHVGSMAEEEKLAGYFICAIPEAMWYYLRHPSPEELSLADAMVEYAGCWESVPDISHELRNLAEVLRILPTK